MTQVTFNMAASGDDGVSFQTQADNIWPPTATPGSNDNAATVAVRKVNHETFVFCEARVALFRWDTSSIPEDAVVNSATLRVWVNSKADVNNRSLIGEWYDAANWPIGTNDYALDVGTNALSGVDITSITTGDYVDFALANPSNVSKTGYTGLRFGVSGGDPGQPGDNDNSVAFLGFDDTVAIEPRLIVDYDVPPTLTSLPRRGMAMVG